MRFESKLTADADVKMTPKIGPSSSLDSFDLFEGDLPDDFQELATQLSADADRLTGCYPAQAHGEFAVGGLVPANDARQPGHGIVSAPGRWMKLVPRVAAAIGLLAGLTLVVGYSSAW